MNITILVDKTSWFNEYVPILKTNLEKDGHEVQLINSKKELGQGDVAFFLSCFEILDSERLKKHKHNIVVHASDLPKGKGWSPMTWQILEGKNEITLTLFEAIEKCDAGCIYLQTVIELDGTELIKEWQHKLALKTISLCEEFIEKYDGIQGTEQVGTESFYKRRRPIDSKLDADKTIREQFNLLRTVDNNRYPAYFEIAGNKYIVKIEKASRNTQ
jgi:methionyl-tRNA formyltransferase